MIEELPKDINDRRQYLKDKGFNISERLLSKTYLLVDQPIFSLGNRHLSCGTVIGEPTLGPDQIYVIYKQNGNSIRGALVPTDILSVSMMREKSLNTIINNDE